MSIQAPLRIWGLSCRGSAEEVARARRWTREALRDCPCVKDAVLIVSELATNAVTHTASGHGSGTFRVILVLTETMLAISVIDSGGTSDVPRVNHARDDAVHGRGLYLVAALASRLEIARDAHGHTTIAALPLKPAEQATSTPRHVPPADQLTRTRPMSRHRRPRRTQEPPRLNPTPVQRLSPPSGVRPRLTSRTGPRHTPWAATRPPLPAWPCDGYEPAPAT